MSTLDEIRSKAIFDAAWATQLKATFDALQSVMVGSDHLSALIKATITGALFDRLDTSGTLGTKWIVLKEWQKDTYQIDSRMRTTHCQLYPPYSTSMDAKIPGENIVMLAKQRRKPGSQIERWSALQEKAKVAYMANDPILACRLNGLHAYILTEHTESARSEIGIVEGEDNEPI